MEMWCRVTKRDRGIVCIVFLFSLICSFAVPLHAAAYSGGSGTTQNPYLISTVQDWVQLMEPNETDWNKHFVVTEDLDMSKIPVVDMKPVGNPSIPFTGTLEGNGHIIDNVTINDPNGIYYVGLFGRVGPRAEIYNLVLKNANITGKYCVGGLVGSNEGIIDSCSSEVSIAGFYDNGGVCINDNVGGLVGYNLGSITSCRSSGTIADSRFYIGGLVGFNWYGTIDSSYSNTKVNGRYYVGGLIGYTHTGTINHSYSCGQVNPGENTGGLAGGNTKSLFKDCFWDINTSTKSNGVANQSPDPNVVVIGHTTSEMQTQSTFTSAGWDFTDETANGDNNYWRLCSSSEPNYPRLNWEFNMIGDFECPDGVNIEDFGVFSGCWQERYNYEANINKLVDINDLLLIIDNWLRSDCGSCNGADITMDNKVNLLDFEEISGRWLRINRSKAAINNTVDINDLLLIINNWLESNCGFCNGADIKTDNKVNLDDFKVLSEQWSLSENIACQRVDLNYNDEVDLADLMIFAGYWLKQ